MGHGPAPHWRGGDQIFPKKCCAIPSPPCTPTGRRWRSRAPGASSGGGPGGATQAPKVPGAGERRSEAAPRRRRRQAAPPSALAAWSLEEQGTPAGVAWIYRLDRSGPRGPVVLCGLCGLCGLVECDTSDDSARSARPLLTDIESVQVLAARDLPGVSGITRSAVSPALADL
eukprot:gene19142-biopygen2475